MKDTMQLPGTLRSTTLGDILGALIRAQLRGVLELTENSGCCAGQVHRVHLDAGFVRDVETTSKVARLGEILREQGHIGEGTMRVIARSGPARHGRRLGEWMVESRLIGCDVLESALRAQKRARLEVLFRISDARLAFRAWVPRRAHESQSGLDPSEFLHGRPRRRDRPDDKRSARIDRERVRALARLGLGPGADATQVRRAFRRLAAELHPDRFPHASASERTELMRRFAEISAAYHAVIHA